MQMSFLYFTRSAVCLLMSRPQGHSCKCRTHGLDKRLLTRNLSGSHVTVCMVCLHTPDATWIWQSLPVQYSLNAFLSFPSFLNAALADDD